ncbi:hypothetical protein Lfu02_00720 [Longispora fulva]|uniref:Uncharacterized protein n=1 Tax=Longispora fulva TaxID=619741 RepID=A0A8J7GH33_9ACTN|nr:hypothetical protein [Longispora fulva]MBG6136058.1 hypothetical protein [Longispora fulva]GIG55700.1 hypothetical protein Lfu02_00720 [Longispora fulva]
MEELAAWHNGRDDLERMVVIVRRNLSSGSCEVQVSTAEGPKLQELLTEANAFALATQIRKTAKGRWERVNMSAQT